MEIKEDKAALRGKISAFCIHYEERVMSSEAVCRRLRARVEWGASGTVLLYAPLVDELDLLPLMFDEKRFCFPRYQGDRGYCAAYASSPESLVPGNFGIAEPPVDAVEIPAREVDFAVVPGVAFGMDCHRLGRGSGFYDRWLTDLAGKKIGVGFDHQLIDSVPCEEHDVQLDGVAKPLRWVEPD